jgi:hypothetical protein
VPITVGWQALAATSLGVVGGAAIVGAICLVLALLSLGYLEETFGKDLDHLEDT